MKKWGLLFGLFVLTLVIAACGDEAGSGTGQAENLGSTSADIIKIGSLHPLSGGLALEGQEMRDAVKLAVEQRNEAGGIESLGGAKIELIETDHEGSPEKGISEVQKLGREGALGIIGAYSSGVALPATQEAERAGIPFVIDIGSANEITERGFKYTYRLQPAATTFSKDFLDILQDLNENADDKLEKLVLVHEDSVFGTSIASAIKDLADDYNIEVVNVLPHAASAADLSSTINKISAVKPDIVVATTYLRDGVMLVEGIKNSNFTPKAIIGVANGAFSNASFLTEHQKINSNIMDVNYTINQKSDLANEVSKEYKEKFGRDLGPNGAYSYMATVVLLDAIERAGTTDRAKIREEISKTKLEEHILAAGIIEFDEKGQNINARAVLNQIKDGVSYVVGPEEYKVEEPVYPQN
ncbi:ABC transporter substrate-binding protein [Solibacillus sp. FSL W7-1464]|uniref:ABC transporter substrate-binding protein n=1 Tax=Solibacillus sp. FSL W7-1464 TaxID=2921706 RepID=UPI0030F4C039